MADEEEEDLLVLDVLGDDQIVINVRPEDSVWFAFMMLPPIAFRSNVSVFQVWLLVVLPVVALVVFNCVLQGLFLLYLYPIIETNECVNEGWLTEACAVVLTFAVAGGEISDAVHIFEYLRVMPNLDGPLTFNVQRGKVVRGGLTNLWRLLSLLCCVVVRFFLALAVLQVSIAYIAITEEPDDKIKDSVAFLILVEIDDIFFAKGCGSFWKNQLEKIPALRVDLNNDSLFHTLWNLVGLVAKPLIIVSWAALSVRGFCDEEASFPQKILPAQAILIGVGCSFFACCFARCTFVDEFNIRRVFFFQSIEPGVSSFLSETELETKDYSTQPLTNSNNSTDSYDVRLAEAQAQMKTNSSVAKLNHLVGAWCSDRHEYIEVLSMTGVGLYVAFDADHSELHRIEVDEQGVTVNGYKLMDTSDGKLVWHGTKADQDDQPVHDELIWQRRTEKASVTV